MRTSGALDRFKAFLQDPPPAMAFEISEAGVAAARIGSRAELEFCPLKPGALAVSPLKDNIVDPDAFSQAVRKLVAAHAGRKRRGAALILPDFSVRVTALDFDSFPSDSKEQLALVRFRLKRSVPFDVETALVSYWAHVSANKRVDVVAAAAPLEIVARYEAPFRAAGLQPGFITTSGVAALELAEETGLNVVAKLSGRVLSVLVRDKSTLRLSRCLELSSTGLDEVAAVLIPTFVYMEDNLGGRAEKLYLCGFGAETDDAGRRLAAELDVDVEPLRSPLGATSENNAGLLGYLRSIGRNN
jgi:type IV pilus assembly protein PilM